MSSTSGKIVVVGGSAGGLEAVTRLIAELPDNVAAAILVVLHLNASVPSMLPSILARRTRLRVRVPQDGMRIESGTIYPAPPDRHLLVDDGVLRLGRGARENNFRPAADPLFRTAAAAYGERVMGIVVSGNLDDGSWGLLAIKRSGGRTMVQAIADALYPGMPSSALQVVRDIDHVVPAADMGAVVEQWAGVTRQPEVAITGGMPVGFDVAIGGEEPVAKMQSGEAEARNGSFGCPACGGVLRESRDGELFHYRCRVGHAYSDEALLAAQTDTLETALWTALRALEETAEQANSLGQRMRTRGHPRLAERFARQAADATRRAAIVRQALVFNQQNNNEPPLADTA